MKVRIDFEDLPPLIDDCDCYWNAEGDRERYDKESHSLAPCTLCRDGERPSEFGLAVLDLVRRFGGKGEVPS